jgi:hypothetical protein
VPALAAIIATPEVSRWWDDGLLLELTGAPPEDGAP